MMANKGAGKVGRTGRGWHTEANLLDWAIGNTLKACPIEQQSSIVTLCVSHELHLC